MMGDGIEPETTELRGVVMSQTFCKVHCHASRVPIHVHHIWPKEDGGPDITANKVALCANGHYSIHYLIDLAKKMGGMEKVPWEIRRGFGPKTRALAELGWDRITRQAM